MKEFQKTKERRKRKIEARRRNKRKQESKRQKMVKGKEEVLNLKSRSHSLCGGGRKVHSPPPSRCRSPAQCGLQKKLRISVGKDMPVVQNPRPGTNILISDMLH